jgi:hypothetical protein
MYNELRSLALNAKPADLGLTLNSDAVSVYGIVMDMGLERGTATLTAFSTGDASLYLSTGGGIIGGIGHAPVRQSVRAWIQSASEHLASFSATATFEVPANGQVRFFVLTNRGILGTTVREADFHSDKVDLAPVWYAGQQVLTDLRVSMDKPTD